MQDDNARPPITSLCVEAFRCFSSLTIHTTHWKNLILGSNGSGKTSLVWALLLLLRGYNTRAKRSTHTESELVEVQRLDELADLFNYPGLTNSSFGAIFCPSTLSGHPHEVIKVSGDVCGSKFTCQYNTSGVLSLCPNKHDPPAEEIRFAFMSPETVFTSPRKEVDDVDVLSSAVPAARKLFRALSLEFKAHIHPPRPHHIDLKESLMLAL
jgi:energy-coupling factor transporter ATP-binding protein EcfA2